MLPLLRFFPSHPPNTGAGVPPLPPPRRVPEAGLALRGRRAVSGGGGGAGGALGLQRQSSSGFVFYFLT